MVARRRCGRQPLLLLLLRRRRRRLSPVVHRGMNCLHQTLRNVGAFVRCGPAYRKQRRAFALFHPLQRFTVTLIAAPFPTPASLSDSLCQTHAISCCFYGPPFSNGVLPQLLRLRLPRRRHPPPCVLCRFPLLFWCHRLPHCTHSIFRSLFGPIMFSGKSAR